MMRDDELMREMPYLETLAESFMLIFRYSRHFIYDSGKLYIYWNVQLYAKKL